MSLFTKVAIASALVDDVYNVVPTRAGFQVNLKLKGLTDDDKVRLLHDGKAALIAAGYPEDSIKTRLSQPPRDGGRNWTPWPCMFVNRPTEAAVTAGVDFSAQIKAAEAAGLTAEQTLLLLKNLGAPAAVVGADPEGEATPETTPEADATVF